MNTYSVIVDRWEDYSEKSYKVWKGDASAYFPKSIFDLGNLPNEFVCDRKNKWRIDKLEEAADRELMEV